MKRPSIVLSDISYRYPSGAEPGAAAFEAKGLRFEEGSCYAISGPCGSGKTTLAMLLKGLVAPTAGTIELENSDGTLEEFQRDMGFAFQFPEEQFFKESVAEEVAFGPALLMKEDVEKRVEESLSAVGLPYGECAHLSPFELSSGQQRRLAIASVFACDPSWCLFDEPTAGLDLEGRRLVLALLERLRARDRTVLVITQELGVFASLCDEVILLENGRVILKAATGSFLENDRRDTVSPLLPYHIRVLKALCARGWELPTGLIDPGEAASLILHRIP